MSQAKPDNAKIVKILLGVVVMMTAFGFALVPLYDVLCDITGLGNSTKGQAEYKQTVIDQDRLVTVEFVSSIASGMPWEFKPHTFRMKVKPGELHSTSFLARNRDDKVIIGQAIPSISPGRANAFFHKTECFCFQQQPLKGGEVVDMGLKFYVDPELPKDIESITLLYTLHNITDRVADNQVSQLGQP